MIRVEVSEQGSGAYRHRGLSFPFVIHEYGIVGQSSEPLLDACRLLARAGVDASTPIGLFDPGATEYRLKTTIGYGARHTVVEPDRGAMNLGRYQELDRDLSHLRKDP